MSWVQAEIGSGRLKIHKRDRAEDPGIGRPFPKGLVGMLRIKRGRYFVGKVWPRKSVICRQQNQPVVCRPLGIHGRLGALQYSAFRACKGLYLKTIDRLLARKGRFPVSEVIVRGRRVPRLARSDHTLFVLPKRTIFLSIGP